MSGFLTFILDAMEVNPMTIYQNIRDLREDHDLTQQQVADVLHTSRTSYGAYENGISQFSPAQLIRLAEFYQTSVDYLLGLTDQKAPYPRKKRQRGDDCV